MTTEHMRPGDFLAPDGIIIRPIDGVDSALASVVVGIIPPSDADYPVHAHYALEQITLVLRGRVTAVSRGLHDERPSELELGPGRAITTPPTTTLSFRNRGPEPAEVLFICVPGYPPTNADTELVGSEHRPLSREELARAVDRQRRAQALLHALLDSRLQSLRWLLPADEPR